MTNLLQDFAQLFFPHLCAGCSSPLHSSREVICPSCLDELPFTEDQFTNHSLFYKLGSLAPISGIYSLCYYVHGSPFQQMIHQFKFKKQQEVGRVLGRLLGQTLEQLLPEQIDCIIPVPLHYKRYQQRGFNQAQVIANEVGKIIAAPLQLDVLQRHNYRQSQTKQHKLERFTNVADSFSIKKKHAEIAGQHILLLDDIITTGATIVSCCQLLHQQGAASIYVASLGKPESF